MASTASLRQLAVPKLGGHVQLHHDLMLFVVPWRLLYPSAWIAQTKVGGARRPTAGNTTGHAAHPSGTRRAPNAGCPSHTLAAHRQQNCVVIHSTLASSWRAAAGSAKPPKALLAAPTPAKLSRHTRYERYGSSSGSSASSRRAGGTRSTSVPSLAVASSMQASHINEAEG